MVTAKRPEIPFEFKYRGGTVRVLHYSAKRGFIGRTIGTDRKCGNGTFHVGGRSLWSWYARREGVQK